MKIKALISIGAIILIIQSISCTNDDIKDRIIFDSIECLGEVEILNDLLECDSTLLNLNENLCEIIPFGKFKLLEGSKEFIPQYCLEVGDRIKYKNELEEDLELTIGSKFYIASLRTSTAFFNCESDSSKYKSYCLENELIYLRLNTSNDSIKFIITISTIPDVSTTEIGKVGDLLTIARRSGSGFIEEQNSIINQRTLTPNYGDRYDQEFFNNIKILDETFENVYSTAVSNESYKYYYNSKYGLIGFVDENDITWKLK